MDLQLLQSFITLAEDRSFTRAAARQHLSQPALSRRIRSLEHWVGTDLVDRSTYPVTLTPAGRQLRRRAADLLEGLHELRDEARGYRPVPPGAVRVATSHSLASGSLPLWRQLTAGSQPLCKLLATNVLDAYDALAAGACDLLLTYTDPAHPLELDPDQFEYLTIGSDVFAPYALKVNGRPKFRLPGSRRWPVPLLDYGPGAFFGRIVDDILRRSSRASHIETAIVTDHGPSLLALAAAGTGVAWLPGRLAADSGQLVAAGGTLWCRDLDIRVYRPRATAGRHAVADHLWERLIDGDGTEVA
jgi:DNA-binding transcriptional LysR family regulator